MGYLWEKLLTSRIVGCKSTKHSSSNSGCGGATPKVSLVEEVLKRFLFLLQESKPYDNEDRHFIPLADL